ncbi:MAG: hypothetical protein E7301_05080 [Butyrivibrio sp.]|nr:hypothetical protein [Butyrivibrio sp.]
MYIIAIILVLCGGKKTSHAETLYTYFPQKTTVATGEVGSISIGVGSSEESISDIRSNSKKFWVKLFKTETYNASGRKWYTVQFCSHKPGIYKIKYIYTGADGKRVKKAVKVNVTDESPIEYVKFNGKKLDYEYDNISKKIKGKLIVKAAKGYKIKKIEHRYFKYDPSISDTSEEMSVIVKNNKRLVLSDEPFIRKIYGENSWIDSASIVARNEIVITYKDKFSKQEMTRSYYIYTWSN